ncbi:MAG TPA: aminoglycoside phosphotransferase family protein [Chitinophagaceae bacterium]|nr:aminoglycoside phosphotransferase family protein [Chitinophagaceae bacterium]
MPTEILSFYGINNQVSIKSYGTGLINHTWKVHTPLRDYILQRINQLVFQQPEHIAHNMEVITDHLQKNEPGYFFPVLVKTLDGKKMVFHAEKGYFRLFPFINGSCSHDVAKSAHHAYEAARQFGLFAKMLSKVPVEQLKQTIPDFHNLVLRYEQFKKAIQEGNPMRIAEANKEIDFIREHDFIVKKFQEISQGGSFKLRPTHHDTKISNVLFDKSGNGLCVVDLDTVMPGYFLSDVGDMMRTYLCAFSEEERDLKKIEIREEYFAAIMKGYLGQMADVLTEEETNNFVYAGVYMTYMQAMRFLTDYLNNDVYYGAAYEKHNYARARNQLTLLARILEKEEKLKQMICEEVDKSLPPSKHMFS